MFYKNLFCFLVAGGGAIAPFTPPLDPPTSCGALGMGSAAHSLRNTGLQSMSKRRPSKFKGG